MLRPAIYLLLLLLAPTGANAGEQAEAVLYKSPSCSCCDGHADHMRSNGFQVTVVESENMSLIKQKYGVPEEFEGCHTIVIGDYVVEGHVPASIISKLLRERPAIRGIALPGMPQGSPGMSGVKEGQFEIYEIADGAPKIFARD